MSVRAGFAMVAMIMTLATFVGNKQKTEPIENNFLASKVIHVYTQVLSTPDKIGT